LIDLSDPIDPPDPIPPCIKFEHPHLLYAVARLCEYAGLESALVPHAGATHSALRRGVIMSATNERQIAQILTAHESDILAEWLKRQQEEGRSRYDEAEARDTSSHFLKVFAAAVQHGDMENVNSPHWHGVRDILADLSRNRAQQGYSPSETATFVFSL